MPTPPMVATSNPAFALPQNDSHLYRPAIIKGLPDYLEVVPNGPVEWSKWKIMVSAHREYIRRLLKEDPEKWGPIENEKCKRSFSYWLTMYGTIFEPRSVQGEKPGWKRWIPFAFQVQMGDWIQDVLTYDEQGRGDGIVEKSREMGATWLFCAFMCWAFLYWDVFVAGIISRNEELVDKIGDTDTIFYKLRAILGLIDAVPEEVRLPEIMQPAGFNLEDHSFHRLIMHPYKTCVLKGETTTELSGVGGRATMRFNDESARFPQNQFSSSWTNQAATTFHRFAVSSADNKSPAFYTLARLGEKCLTNPGLDGPSYMRLEWHIHPLHTQKWYDNEKARISSTDPAGFEREYNINYFAGQGNNVYPRFMQMTTGSFPFDPHLGQVYCFIDPGISDPSAMIWLQEDTQRARYRVFNGFQGVGGEDAEFYASVMVGVPISGYGGVNYEAYPGLLNLMDFLANLKRKIIYFGDPYGNNRGGDGKKTWYNSVRDASALLTNGANKIFVQTVTSEDARAIATRKEAVNKMANKIDFDDSPGATQVLTALQRSHYPDAKEGSDRTFELLIPVHDDNSHLRTAWEFGMININRREIAKEANQSETYLPARMPYGRRR